ncbi:MAG: hypothetical protein OXU73_00705 [Candidatus Campbellbacteria bacterium]|nr:hypothetical protein [Candidatus Campbellbacteria bacterium]
MSVWEKHKTLISTVLIFLGLVLAFWLGMEWHKAIYFDICLDLGGGSNPGGYPICVVEEHRL